MNDQVHYEVEDGVATLTLDNPEYRNALSLEMTEGIKEAIAAAEDSDARCVVMEADHEAFCAGGDIQSMLEALTTDAEIEALIDDVGEPVNRTVETVYQCDLPTIAKVDGAAYGAGGTLAIANDIVIASDEAELSFSFRRVGLSVDSGTSYVLPRMVGENTAKNLVFRDTVLDAEEAADLGLFQEVHPASEFEDAAAAVVEEVATGPTMALENTKDLVQHGLHRTMDEAINHEIASLKEIFRTDDFSEGVHAFLERRSPEFEGK